MLRRGSRFVVVAVVLVAAGCVALQADLSPTVTVGSGDATGAASTTSPTVPTRDCSPLPNRADALPVRIEALDPVEASIAVSQTVFPCADRVVVAAGDDFAKVALGAQLAAAWGGPLLVAGDGEPVAVEAELERLAPRHVTLVGLSTPVVAPAHADVEIWEGSLAELTEAVRAAHPVGAQVSMATTGVPAASRILQSINKGLGVWVPAVEPIEACDRDDEQITAAIESRARVADLQGDLWLVDACSPELAMAAGAAARYAGGTVLLVDGRDLRTSRAVAEAVPGSTPPERVVLLGEITSDADWQVAALVADKELPGGGLTLFPDRRIVALYGNPTTAALGVMGEQGPEEAVERAREVAAPYGADGTEILPAFEIIATVASASATDDGNYSWEMSVEELLPWVEVAAREGLYVTLDLQPGRTDFLTQAQRYEELLLLPHVGLALDPEWRLKPNQKHLQQIGSVDAAEVNQVADWLANLVRDNHLPQKLLILHQFNFSMITNRELVDTPPELAVLVHVDGQGPIHTKYETYGALAGAPDSDQWWWGWKNFYDEDSPTPTPSQVLELDPLPVYVSYQ